MRIKVTSKNRVAASSRAADRRRVMADEEVEIAPEATELLFETQDVADLVAEVTGEDVTVEATPEAVEFTVGEDDVYTVEPEGDEELVEASRRVAHKSVRASRRVVRRR